MRRRRPAQGQLTFAFVLDWLPATPPPVLPSPPPPAETPPPRPAHWWRRRRPAAVTPQARSPDRDARTVTRWLRRGASCVLCGFWPAPIDRRVGGRLLLLCRACAAKPEALVRLAEIVRVDWAAHPAVT
jgi:hypothetical protein